MQLIRKLIASVCISVLLRLFFISVIRQIEKLQSHLKIGHQILRCNFVIKRPKFTTWYGVKHMNEMRTRGKLATGKFYDSVMVRARGRLTQAYRMCRPTVHSYNMRVVLYSCVYGDCMQMCLTQNAINDAFWVCSEYCCRPTVVTKY